MVGDILQPTHLLFILVVALLVLGPKRLPEVGRTLGSGLRDFRQAINGESTNHDDHDDHEPRAYVETEPDIEPEVDTGPAFADDEPAPGAVEADAVEHGAADESAWTPDPDVDTGPAFAAADDAESGTAETGSGDGEPVPSDAAPQPDATASSSGFASALAASRQRAGGDEPADDE